MSHVDGFLEAAHHAGNYLGFSTTSNAVDGWHGLSQGSILMECLVLEEQPFELHCTKYI
jgi:hypothetical protein